MIISVILPCILWHGGLEILNIVPPQYWVGYANYPSHRFTPQDTVPSLEGNSHYLEECSYIGLTDFYQCGCGHRSLSVVGPGRSLPPLYKRSVH